MILTREYIHNLPAGDEMDALVAEKIMGWHIGNNISIGKCWYDGNEEYQHGIFNGAYEDDEDFHLLHWHPSSSILWAWEVVDCMFKRGFYLTLEQFQVDYQCMFDNSSGEAEYAVADAAPLAICRSALMFLAELDTVE